MYGIALLLIVTGTAQTPPPDEPPPLERGEATYEVELHDGTFIYARAQTNDFDERTGTGSFWVDEPDAVSGSIPYAFKRIWPESPENRVKRWTESVAAWHERARNVQVKSADGPLVWVKEEDAQWSDRARAAALSVIQKRESLEAMIVEAPAATEIKSQDEDQPGFLELWGPQAAVGVLGLVLMGVAGSLLIFSGDVGWSKIE